MIAEPELRFCDFFIVQKIPDQNCRIRSFALFYPVYLMTFTLQFAEKYILPFGELAYFVEQLCVHFFKGIFSLQIKRDFPVFQTERFQFVKRYL